MAASHSGGCASGGGARSTVQALRCMRRATLMATAVRCPVEIMIQKSESIVSSSMLNDTQPQQAGAHQRPSHGLLRATRRRFDRRLRPQDRSTTQHWNGRHTVTQHAAHNTRKACRLTARTTSGQAKGCLCLSGRGEAAGAERRTSWSSCRSSTPPYWAAT